MRKKMNSVLNILNLRDLWEIKVEVSSRQLETIHRTEAKGRFLLWKQGNERTIRERMLKEEDRSYRLYDENLMTFHNLSPGVFIGKSGIIIPHFQAQWLAHKRLILQSPLFQGKPFVSPFFLFVK